MCRVTFSKIVNSCFVRGIVKGINVTTPTSTFGLGTKELPIFSKNKCIKFFMNKKCKN